MHVKSVGSEKNLIRFLSQGEVIPCSQRVDEAGSHGSQLSEEEVGEEDNMFSMSSRAVPPPRPEKERSFSARSVSERAYAEEAAP